MPLQVKDQVDCTVKAAAAVFEEASVAWTCSTPSGAAGTLNVQTNPPLPSVVTDPLEKVPPVHPVNGVDEPANSSEVRETAAKPVPVAVTGVP